MVRTRALDGRSGEGGIAAGGPEVALRATGQGQGAEGEGEQKEGFHDGLLRILSPS